MRTATDPRPKIKEILNMWNYDHCYMKCLVQGRQYKFFRRCDDAEIGTLEREIDSNGTIFWNFQVWCFDLWRSKMEYCHALGDYSTGWVSYDFDTVAKGMAKMNTEAIMAEQVIAAKKGSIGNV